MARDNDGYWVPVVEGKGSHALYVGAGCANVDQTGEKPVGPVPAGEQKQSLWAVGLQFQPEQIIASLKLEIAESIAGIASGRWGDLVEVRPYEMTRPISVAFTCDAQSLGYPPDHPPEG